MPDKERLRKRASTVDAIRRAIEQPRPMDDWRKAHICAAISCFHSGLYGLAAIQADLSTLPISANIPFKIDTETQQLTLEDLRDSFAAVEQMPPAPPLLAPSSPEK